MKCDILDKKMIALICFVTQYYDGCVNKIIYSETRRRNINHRQPRS